MFNQIPVRGMAFQNEVDNLDLLVGEFPDQFQETAEPRLGMVCPAEEVPIYLSDEQIEIILEGCIHNQRGAQKKLYRNYYSYAMSLALPYSSVYENAVEIINQAFLKIYRYLKKYAPLYDNTVISFTQLLNKTVMNVGINNIGKYNKRETMETADRINNNYRKKKNYERKLLYK